MNRLADPALSARGRVVEALIPATEAFPELGPSRFEPQGLTPRDLRLAVAIHRTVLQRWMTLEHLLDAHLRKPLASLEPPLRAVLLVGAAQIAFMHRLPRHAVVDEAVRIARRLMRSGAGGMANAVLRRLADDVMDPPLAEPWTLAVDRLPLDDGCVQLARPLLPDPATDLAEHLAVATSHPTRLLRRWIADHGEQVAVGLAFAGTRIPPTLVAVEAGFRPEPDDRYHPHEQAGFLLWQAGQAQLTAFLAEHPDRRVQDPAAAATVEATVRSVVAAHGDRPLGSILDYCAGRGTKTRQLAQLHPQARILATDTDPLRRRALHELFDGHAAVRVVPPQAISAEVGQGVDLLLLDVPCSNTGVLARRPEARYRFRQASEKELVELQREIILLTAPLVRRGGCLLYSTCSLEPAENREQVAWMTGKLDARVLTEQLILPAGVGQAYHDGSYHALLQVPAD